MDTNCEYLYKQYCKLNSIGDFKYDSFDDLIDDVCSTAWMNCMPAIGNWRDGNRTDFINNSLSREETKKLLEEVLDDGP